MMAYSTAYRRILNKMGYYAYQNGLIYSHLSQEGGWDGHLERCRKFINRALEYYKPATVTVLGSGWLLDLPLAEMLEGTGTVYLVDIIHPPEVIKQTADIGKVILVEQDVTGGMIEEVWEKTGKFSFSSKLKTLESISKHHFVPDFDPGFVISLNILTQLESRLIERLKKRAAISDNELLDFRKDIQEQHIEFLSRYPSVLISDYAEVITKKSGDVSTIQTLFATLPQGLFRDEWTWDFDLKGNENYNSRSVMKVFSVAF